jgi:predicted deacylase
LVSAPVALTELIAIAIEACLDIDEGNFNRNIPGMLVGLLSQSLDLFRKAASLLSVDIITDYSLDIHISCGMILFKLLNLRSKIIGSTDNRPSYCW